MLLVELDDEIDPAVNARAVQLAGALENARFAGVRDVVPTFRSVAIHFDPLKTDFSALSAAIDVHMAEPGAVARSSGPPVRIPVCYGFDFGPDLAAVAALAGISEPEVIALHSAVRYRVFMVGFLPGFAYLGRVDDRIAVPRRASPRLRVPAGSVGIAGQQTGVYPVESPGGWQLIGRTPVRPFDLSRKEPFLLKAGDEVEFYGIDAAEYGKHVDSSGSPR
jgi:inhibitor of KinA